MLSWELSTHSPSPRSLQWREASTACEGGGWSVLAERVPSWAHWDSARCPGQPSSVPPAPCGGCLCVGVWGG